MDSVQNEYLRITQFLMSRIGQWPYQSNRKKILIQMIFIPLVFLQTVLQAGGTIAGFFADDIPVFLENMTFVMATSFCITKYVNYTYNHKQMKNLTVTMAEDWNSYSKSSQEEYDILCKCYATGKRIAFFYSVTICGLMCPFTFMPGILSIADIMGYYNMTEKVLMYPVQYFVDLDKYYYHLIVYGHIGTMGNVLLVIAIDSMLIFNVQHECALCEILKYRLERILDAVKLDISFNANNKDDVEYLNARTCVIMHNHIIKYAESIENANTTACLLQLGFIMMSISLSILQAVVQLNELKEALRKVTFTICTFSVLYLQTWPGQQLSDSTENIFVHIANSKWYDFSSRSKKIINIMLLRSYQPLKLTAGKLYMLNMQNYGSVAKTCFSFFTVLRST